MRITTLILLIILITNSANAVEIYSIVFDYHENNVLKIDAYIETSEVCNAYIDYYYIEENGDTIKSRTNISTNQMEHEWRLIKLLANTTYYYQINAFNQSGFDRTPWSDIATDSIPNNIVSNIAVSLNTPQATDGFIMLNQPRRTGDNHFTLFDRKGRLVWYELMDSGMPRGCGGFNWGENNNFIQVYDCNALLETDVYGNEINDIGALDRPYIYHHDVIINNDGNIVVLTAFPQTIDRTSMGGSAETTVIGDGIMIINQEGEIIWEWSIFDHPDRFDPLIGGNTGYYDGVYGEEALDWTHANAVYQDIDGNYLMSLRLFSQIIKINAQTGEIMWVLGEGGDFQMNEEDYFLFQHNITVTDEGNYLLFDNGGSYRAISRVLEFDLDTNNMQANLVWSHTLPAEDYSAFVSSAQRLKNGNTLIGAGFIGQIIEVNKDGEIVWKADNDSTFFFRANYIPDFVPPVELEAPTIDDLSNTTCLFENPINLTGTPSNGYFEGNGVVNGKFSPESAGLGTHTITYHYGWLSTTTTIEVLDVLSPTLEQKDSLLTATEGYNYYEWYKDDVLIDITNTADFIMEGAGDYYVRVLDAESCAASSSIISIAQESILNLPNTVCLNDAPILLEGTADNGYFEGNGVVDGQFLPELAGIGTHEITYHYGWVSTTQQVEIRATPIPIIEYNGDAIIVIQGYTYEWYKNDTLLINETEASLIIQGAGDYYVVITDEHLCSAASEIVNIAVTSTEEIAQNSNLTKFNIFPNPFSQKIQIAISLSKKTTLSVNIYELSGKKVAGINKQIYYKGENHLPLNLSSYSLPKGIYLVEIIANEQVTYHKIVKE